ncbi:MAG: helix-turn-helix domain-containing protein [Tannerella sp.]|jgi:AraC-like DNA-binding protein|nr:helix-turn-helix domain-containing protein [Tannerella sp.]
MQYAEYQPNRLLGQYIETYWTSSVTGGTGRPHKILPDGCVDIIFMFDRAAETVYAKIVGTMTTALEVTYPQTIQFFGIRFKPAGITAFTRVPVHEFTDRDVELSLVNTLFDKSFGETLTEKQTPEEFIAHTDNYLINKMSGLYRYDRQIISAVELIDAAKGRLSPAQVASDVCLCPRHFERRFKSAIGISPKTFSNILRFRHSLKYLQNYPRMDLLSAAVACGYYDHTHLIKDFRTFSGETPTALR